MWQPINTAKDRSVVFMWDGTTNGRVWIQEIFKVDEEFCAIYKDHFWQPIHYPEVPKSKKPREVYGFENALGKIQNYFYEDGINFSEFQCPEKLFSGRVVRFVEAGYL